MKKEEVKDVEFDYARRWQAQGGDDSGIPKEYTPCKFFFKARDSCQMSKCLFSHNTDIFCQEPFASILQNLSWERKAKTKTFPRPPPTHHHLFHRRSTAEWSAMKKTCQKWLPRRCQGVPGRLRLQKWRRSDDGEDICLNSANENKSNLPLNFQGLRI